MASCTLCKNSSTEQLVTPDDKRVYHFCNSCYLIFADHQFHPDVEEERARYATHNNGIHQAGYVAFLNRVIVPSLQYLTPGMVGLDYGCGPAPTLSEILKLQKITCHNFDPIFNFQHPLEIYDFVFSTECLEHFFIPSRDLQIIAGLVRTNGYLSIMTALWSNLEQFKTWYYKRDFTHISFYHRKTFDYICDRFGFSLKYTDDERVLILQKN
jgi:SAM-dependent methyltransferase